MTRYFISDPHFRHKNITEFERHNFNSVQEHDAFLLKCFEKWARKLKPEDEFWVLGDWGETEFLFVINMFQCKTCFVMGNHDAQADIDKFRLHFDEVYEYPVYLSNKLVVSHLPVAVFEDQINIHGHLHGAVLDSDNYICCSLHVANYTPINDNNINGRFGQIPKYNRRFLWEPFAHLMKFTQEKADVVKDKNGRIDLSASRVLQKLTYGKENYQLQIKNF